MKVTIETMTDILLINSRESLYTVWKAFKESAYRNGLYVVGLDIEYIAKANHLESYENALAWNDNLNGSYPAVCIIQIATSSMCLVINMVKVGSPLPSLLSEMLVSKGWLKGGVNIDSDMNYLSHNYCLNYCGGVIDIELLAKYSGITNPSLSILSSGDKDSENVGRRDWSAELTVSMINYAANDAILSHMLLMKALNTLEKMYTKGSPIEEANTKHSTVRMVYTKEENYVGRLQEYSQLKCIVLPKYTYTTYGNEFDAACAFKNMMVISKLCKNKKMAKQDAAHKMLTEIKSSATSIRSDSTPSPSASIPSIPSPSASIPSPPASTPSASTPSNSTASPARI